MPLLKQFFHSIVKVFCQSNVRIRINQAVVVANSVSWAFDDVIHKWDCFGGCICGYSVAVDLFRKIVSNRSSGTIDASSGNTAHINRTLMFELFCYQAARATLCESDILSLIQRREFLPTSFGKNLVGAKDVNNIQIFRVVSWIISTQLCRGWLIFSGLGYPER